MLGSVLLRRRGVSDVILPPQVVRLNNQIGVMPRVSEQSAMNISAYRRGKRLITRTIGMLPLQIERDGVMTDETLPLFERPVPWMSRQAAIETMVDTLIDYGNYFAVLTQFNAQGRPEGLVPVHPSFVSVALVEGLGLLYRIGGVPYMASDVVHMRTGAGAQDLIGRGVLEQSIDSLTAAIVVSAATTYTYRDGIYPAGILQSDDPDLQQAEADDMRVQWVNKVRRGEPVVLPAGIEWHPTTAPNAEQYLLDKAAQMSRREMADLLDLDGDWLGVRGNTMTYANIVDRVDNLIRFTCQPWMTLIEDAFTELTSRPTKARFETEELFRAQTSERYADYAVGLAGGWLTLADVREDERLPPLPPSAPDPFAVPSAVGATGAANANPAGPTTAPTSKVGASGAGFSIKS